MYKTAAGLHATASVTVSPTDQDIHDRIFEAILARRLRPGARLVEEELARIFAVSRTKVRQALAKLAQDGLVVIRRNHGASVAAPTRAEARHVLELRAMIEPAVAAALARSCPAAGIGMLRQHVAAEVRARDAGDAAQLIRLTGAFHLHLAELHGNDLLCRVLRESEALMCLSILSYGRPGASACLPDEHGPILAAITSGDAAAAAALMLDHLRHVEGGMDLTEPEGASIADALAPAGRSAA